MNSVLSALTCPHLGMRDDPGTYYSYASTGNRCYRCKQPATPLMAHQETVCLRGGQMDCLAFQQGEGKAFPPELRPAAATGGRLRGASAPMTVLAIVAGTAALGFAAWQFLPQISRLKLPGMGGQATVAILPSETAAPAPSASAVPSATVAPSATALIQTHALEEPFEINGIKLLMHRVGGGETFDVLDETYGTTPEVIRSLNPSVGPSLWAKSVILIAPGLEVMDPSLPGFRLHEVREPTVTIERMAIVYNIDAALLMRYNGCTDNCTLSAGDWVLFPVVK